jgi:integrase
MSIAKRAPAGAGPATGTLQARNTLATLPARSIHSDSSNGPTPRFLTEQITASFAGKGPDDLVFQGTRGGVLRNGKFNRRTFGPAAIAIGEPRLTPHGLRHTAYGGISGDSGRGQRQGCSADAWARHGEHDT